MLSPRRTRRFILVLALAGHAAVCLALAGDEPAPASPVRNPRWAERIEHPGLPNLHRVSPVLYRGAQPTKEGLVELGRMGIKTVVSLRAFHGEGEAVRSQGLGYQRISFKVWHAEDEDVRRFLAIVKDPARRPVFVHCQRGADRTGTMVAVYRVCVEGWSREHAIEEMAKGGFGHYGRFAHLRGYLRDLDLPASECSGLGKP